MKENKKRSMLILCWQMDNGDFAISYINRDDGLIQPFIERNGIAVQNKDFFISEDSYINPDEVICLIMKEFHDIYIKEQGKLKAFYFNVDRYKDEFYSVDKSFIDAFKPREDYRYYQSFEYNKTLGKKDWMESFLTVKV